MFPFIVFASSMFLAMMGEEDGSSRYGADKAKPGRKGSTRTTRHQRRKGKKDEGRGGEEEGGQEGGSEGEDLSPLEQAMKKIDLEFDLSEMGDEIASEMFEDDEAFGVFPGPPTGAQILRSAALAQPGSWTERNVLQAGARDAWSRRVAGTATEADYAVLGAARPGITSSESGPISPAWSKSPWPGTGGTSTAEGTSIEDAVLAEMGL